MGEAVIRGIRWRKLPFPHPTAVPELLYAGAITVEWQFPKDCHLSLHSRGHINYATALSTSMAF
jgi:hypothetical protein